MRNIIFLAFLFLLGPLSLAQENQQVSYFGLQVLDAYLTISWTEIGRIVSPVLWHWSSFE